MLFQRGAFGADDAAATALALAIYGAGLPAFVLHKVFQPLYYAREDTRSPFRYAVWSMIVNAAIAVGLMPVIGFAAAALATTVAGWTMVFQLWFGTRAMGTSARFDAQFRTRLPRIVLASGRHGGGALGRHPPSGADAGGFRAGATPDLPPLSASASPPTAPPASPSGPSASPTCAARCAVNADGSWPSPAPSPPG